MKRIQLRLKRKSGSYNMATHELTWQSLPSMLVQLPRKSHSLPQSDYPYPLHDIGGGGSSHTLLEVIHIQ